MGCLVRQQREPRSPTRRKWPRRRRVTETEGGGALGWFPAPFCLPTRGKLSVTAAAAVAAIEGDGNAQSLRNGGYFDGRGCDLGRWRHRAEQPESRKYRAAFPIHGEHSAAALCDARFRGAFHQVARSRSG